MLCRQFLSQDFVNSCNNVFIEYKKLVILEFRCLNSVHQLFVPIGAYIQ